MNVKQLQQAQFISNLIRITNEDPKAPAAKLIKLFINEERARKQFNKAFKYVKAIKTKEEYEQLDKELNGFLSHILYTEHHRIAIE